MRFDRSIIAAYVVACAVLAAGALGFRAAVSQLNVYLVKLAVPLRESLDTLPSTLGDWQRVGTDTRYNDEMVEALGTKSYLDRHYALDGMPSKGVVRLHLAYYTGTIDDVPHVPDRCWTAAGLENMGTSQVRLKLDPLRWRAESGPTNRATGLQYATTYVTDPVTGKQELVCAPVGDIEMHVVLFQNPSRPRERTVGAYLFIANHRLTSSPYGVRALAFDRSEQHAYYCKVEFAIVGLTGKSDEELLQNFTRQAEELFNLLLPHLMRRLPDWPALEASTETASATSAPDAA